MSTTTAVVIPVYREDLNEFEKISLAQGRKVLKNYPLIFVAPEGKIFSYFDSGDMVAHFPTQYFQSKETYSELLTSPFFYETFSDFDYILIYQLDAFVFYDALEEFCSLGYDYIGAAWPLMYAWLINDKRPRVGNGGFSLRNVKNFCKLLTEHSDLIAQLHDMPEDVSISYCGSIADDFKIAPINIANMFSAEYNLERVIKKNGGKFPFGCHDWQNRNKNFLLKNFPLFGWDLRPIQHLMIKDNDTVDLTDWLLKIAIRRLIRRINRGQSFLRYLPTKNFSSVRVIRSPAAMKILAQLLTEENFRADEIFIYDAENRINLFRDLTHEKFPHLLIVADDDLPLIDALEKRGLRYGEHFISFQQEYLKSCEKIFRRLGK